MPIATITPTNNSQSASLAQSLSGTGSSLLSALNSAIQKSRDDAQIQYRQQQDFLNEQQKNIANDRVERFNIQDRTERILDFAERKADGELDRSKKRLNLGDLEETISFDKRQRGLLEKGNATAADFKVRDASEEQKAIKEGVTKTDQAIANKENIEKLEKSGQDPTSRRVKDGAYIDDERKVLEDNNQTPAQVKVAEQTRANEVRERKKVEEANKTAIDSKSVEEINTTIRMDQAGVLDLKAQTPAMIRSAIENINNSPLKDDPDAVRLRNKLESQLKDKFSPEGQTALEVEIANLESITEPDEATLRKISNLKGKLEELKNKAGKEGKGGSPSTGTFDAGA